MAGAVPDPSKINGNAPTVSTIICIALAVIILIGVCVVRKTGALTAVREVATRTRSSLRGGRGLDSQVINSIPIVRYHGTRQQQEQRCPNYEHALSSSSTLVGRKQTTSATASGGRLQTIREDEDDLENQGGVHPAARQRSISARIGKTLKRWRAHIPKRPVPRLQNQKPKLVRQETACPICTEDFPEGASLRRLPCGHLYHPQCIDQWLGEFGVTCPLWQSRGPERLGYRGGTTPARKSFENNSSQIARLKRC